MTFREILGYGMVLAGLFTMGAVVGAWVREHSPHLKKK